MNKHIITSEDTVVFVTAGETNNPTKNWTTGAPSSTFFHDKKAMYNNDGGDDDASPSSSNTTVPNPRKSGARSPRFLLDLKQIHRKNHDKKQERGKQKKKFDKTRNEERKKKDHFQRNGCDDGGVECN